MARAHSARFLSFFITACNAEKPAVAPAKPTPAPVTIAAAPPPVSRWALLEIHAYAPRPHGKGAIAVGALGERWWMEAGTAHHAETFAPMPLVDVVSVLMADDPLGPFGARRAPPAPLHTVSVGKAAILGIDPASPGGLRHDLRARAGELAARVPRARRQGITV